MMKEYRHYAKGTSLATGGPWSVYVAGRALCSDGKVRSLARIAQDADTFFAVPAAVKVNGRTVTGYFTVETLAGFDTPTDADPAVVKFVAVTYGKNADMLPAGKFNGGES